MIGMIIRYKTMETIRYFIGYDKAIDYIVNTSLFNYKEFEEVIICETYINRLGMLDINSDEQMYRKTREEIIKEE